VKDFFPTKVALARFGKYEKSQIPVYDTADNVSVGKESGLCRRAGSKQGLQRRITDGNRPVKNAI
jgi:hypothetical protein